MEKPVLNETVPPEERSPRERMISIANGYWDTLQLNDGTLFTQFDDKCERYEDAIWTANNPNSKDAIARMGCTAQFKSGYFRMDDRVRDRRFPVVDEERGLVLSMAFLDHTGRWNLQAD